MEQASMFFRLGKIKIVYFDRHTPFIFVNLFKSSLNGWIRRYVFTYSFRVYFLKATN